MKFGTRHDAKSPLNNAVRLSFVRRFSAMHLRFSIVLGFIAASLVTSLADEPRKAEVKPSKERRLRAEKLFDLSKPVIFEDDFQSGKFDRWNISENDHYDLDTAAPERISIVPAPGLDATKKSVKFVVERAPNSFRSEISLPHEKGFNERWYAERIFIPEEWVLDPSKANDIVMQWHAIPGNWRATYPNLAISVGNDHWFIRQSFGSPQTKPTRTSVKLDEPMKRGVWTTWVIHAKWSPNEDGLLQIWRDGKPVLERKGANVYGTIGLDYTPYLKTGIYHPEWHLDDDKKRQSFEAEKPIATRKIVYVTDVKLGNEHCTLKDFVPTAPAP